MNVQQTLKDKDHKYATQLEALQKEFSTSSDKRRKEWEKERTKLSAEVCAKFNHIRLLDQNISLVREALVDTVKLGFNEPG